MKPIFNLHTEKRVSYKSTYTL